MAKYKPKRKQNKEGGVSQMWACHLHEKSMYLKAKERIMETQIFHGAKIYNLPKKFLSSLKETKIHQDIITLL